MTGRTPIGVGDLARAFEQLCPADERTRHRIAEALGLQIAPRPIKRPPAGARRKRATRPSSRTSQPEARGKGTTKSSPSPSRARSLAAELKRLPDAQPVKPSWFTRAEPLDRDTGPDFPTNGRLPLIEPAWARSRLTAALAVPAAQGEIDLEAVIASLARSKSIEQLPRLAVPTLRRGAHLLLDLSDAMRYFDDDRGQLIADLQKLASVDRLTVFGFVGCPSRGVYGEGEEDSAPYQPPPPGTPVLLVTDLGLIQPALTCSGVLPDEWLDFLAELSAADCPARVLGPHSRHRLPARLRKVLHYVHWDRDPPYVPGAAIDEVGAAGPALEENSPRAVRLLAGRNAQALELAEWLSPAARMEPELLRAARLELMPGADSACEAEVWFSELVAARNPLAVSLDDDIARWLQTRLAARGRLSRAREFLERFRREADSPQVLRVEEELRFLALEQPDDWVAQAEQRLARVLRAVTAADEDYPADERHGLALWSAGAIPTLDEKIRNLPAAQYLHLAAKLHLSSFYFSEEELPTDFREAAWLWPAGFPQTSMGVRLIKDGVELSEPPAPDAMLLAEVPATYPRILRMRWHNQPWATIRFDGPLPQVVLPLGPAALTLQTLDGKQHELRLVEATEEEAAQGEGGDRLRGPLLQVARTIEAALPEYLPRCRWYADKGRTIERVSIVDAFSLTHDPQFWLTLVDIVTNGETQRYALPVGLATGKRVQEIQSERPETLLSPSTAKDLAHQVIPYDAGFEPEYWMALYELISEEGAVQGSDGTLHGLRTPAFETLRAAESGKRWRPTALETIGAHRLVRIGRSFFAKAACRLARGISREWDIGRWLTDRQPHLVASVAGAVEYRSLTAGEEFERLESQAAGTGNVTTTIALLQQYIDHEADHWKLALEGVSDFVERVRRAPEAVEQFGRDGPLDEWHGKSPPSHIVQGLGDYYKTARLLGHRTAELHLALAGAPNDPDFAPEPMTIEDRMKLAEVWRSSVADTFDLLRHQAKSLGEEVYYLAEEVLQREPQLLYRLTESLDDRETVLKMRCHGDLHLGQILWARDGAVFVDFEGEPAWALTEPKRKVLPFRDLAGMVRSFHYAAHMPPDAASEMVASPPSSWPADSGWRDIWAAWAAAAYLNAYWEAAHDELLPRDRSQWRAWMTAFLLDRALYELHYELTNRPKFAIIPLRAILVLVQGESGFESAPAL